MSDKSPQKNQEKFRFSSKREKVICLCFTLGVISLLVFILLSINTSSHQVFFSQTRFAIIGIFVTLNTMTILLINLPSLRFNKFDNLPLDLEDSNSSIRFNKKNFEKRMRELIKIADNMVSTEAKNKLLKELTKAQDKRDLKRAEKWLRKYKHLESMEEKKTQLENTRKKEIRRLNEQIIQLKKELEIA